MVQQTYRGGGTLVIAFFDYAHEPSLVWWREEYPKLTDLIESGQLRLTLLMYPKPVTRWSVMLPSALFEVRAQTDRRSAWAFHEALVNLDGDYSLDAVAELATDVGADGADVVAAAKARRRRNQAFADKQFGESTGVETLPAFRWGRDPIDGTSAADIRSFVENRSA
ncbi:hypothetical protein [Halobaculum sp. P14]|uniref:hypothetical protein n=1 Tax=Halobaculum sp. P14 TaxID=3421638 RepID=UPI003EBA7492